MTRQHKCPTGPRTVAGLLRWRKGPAEGGDEKPQLRELILFVAETDEPLSMDYLPENYCEVWPTVRYWIPWSSICPSELLPAKRKGKQ